MLHWTNTENIYHTKIEGADTTQWRKAIEACADKAIALLADNIQDDSLYLLFEWNPTSGNLRIVVTDAQKQQDAPISLEALFSSYLKATGNDEGVAAEHTEQIKFWLHDYLTTCTAFFNYSLVAIFHSSNRSQTELL
jgi:hypothetical protein